MERGEQSPQGDPNKNLEGLFAEHFDEIVAVYDGMIGDALTANPELADEMAKVRDFTDKLTGFMLHTDPSPEETQATYMTLQLMYGSYALASETNTRLVYSDFFEVLAEAQDAEKLTAYANSHQTVMRLIDRLRPLIDPSGEHVSLTNTMALLTCMAIEKDLTASSWKDADRFAEQLENWDGDVSDLRKPQQPEFESVDSDLLKTEQDIRDYLKVVNKQLETMKLGDERDAFADAVRVELNTAWAELEMMGNAYTFSGTGVYSELVSEFDENGQESYRCTVIEDEISATGDSLGFAYKSIGGKPAKLWYRVFMGGSTEEIHPTIEREYSLFAFFDETCTICVAEDSTAEGSVMNDVEMEQFNGIDDPDETTESYYTDAAQILSICSQGLRRRMNSRVFFAMSHGEQLRVVDQFIAAATERSQVVDMTAVFEPHHGYVMRPSPENQDEQILTRVNFGDSGLTGRVTEITVHDIDTLLARPIRTRGDRALSVPGLLVAVELMDAHMLPGNVVLKSAEKVLVPMSGQDFDGTFKFIPKQADPAE